MLPKFTVSGPGTLMRVMENDTTTRDKISLNRLEVTKCQSISVSVILKTVMEVA